LLGVPWNKKSGEAQGGALLSDESTARKKKMILTDHGQRGMFFHNPAKFYRSRKRTKASTIFTKRKELMTVSRKGGEDGAEEFPQQRMRGEEVFFPRK